MRVEGQGVLIAGGGSGLGAATARALVGAGARVAILDLPNGGGGEVAKQLGSGCTFVPGDVRETDDVREAASAVGSAPLRIAVVCAGVSKPARMLRRNGPASLADFEQTISVNLTGTFNVFRIAAEAMAQQELLDGERGVLVATASIAAFDGQVGQASYGASKAGVVGMTLPVARDLARHQIRCCTIAPGVFETPMLGVLDEDVREAIDANVPHPSRRGRPDEFAALVRHIVENQMLNGEVIRLDGALRLAPS